MIDKVTYEIEESGELYVSFHFRNGDVTRRAATEAEIAKFEASHAKESSSDSLAESETPPALDEDLSKARSKRKNK